MCNGSLCFQPTVSLFSSWRGVSSVLECFCIIKWKEMSSVEQHIDGYCVLPHDTQLFRRRGRNCLAIPITALVLLSIWRRGDCVRFFVVVRWTLRFVFSSFFFVCCGDRVDLGRMKRNFESSLICFLCFLLHFSSKFCLSKMLVSCLFCLKTKFLRIPYGVVKVQYTTKYCLISFMIRTWVTNKKMF